MTIVRVDIDIIIFTKFNDMRMNLILCMYVCTCVCIVAVVCIRSIGTEPPRPAGFKIRVKAFNAATVPDTGVTDAFFRAEIEPYV